MARRRSNAATEEHVDVEDFERRIYDALMSVARSTSKGSKAALGMCVALNLSFDRAPPAALAEVRRFIEAAELLADA